MDGVLREADGAGAALTVPGRPGELAERAVGFFRIGTGLWLMYLTFAVVLDFVLNYKLTV